MATAVARDSKRAPRDRAQAQATRRRDVARTISRVLLAVAASTAIGAFVASSAQAQAASPACTLYAANGGSNANPGTASAPFATAQRLLERLSPGQTGCLASGQTFAGFTLYAATHGSGGAPITLTSTNPEDPATVDTRVTTEKGANWLTFTRLIFTEDVLDDSELPSPTIGSAHTDWTDDDISANDMGICIAPTWKGDPYGEAEYTLIEGDRVHDCGHPLTLEELECQGVSIFPVCSVEDVDTFEGRENGWHAHGLYDEGRATTVRNSYFYDNSGIGILLRGGSGAVIEHNVIDANGRGVEFGDESPEGDLVAWNIITGTTDPCGRELHRPDYCDTFGLQSSGAVGAGNVFRDNDSYGNEAGNIAPSYDLSAAIELQGNVEVNPDYVNAAAHEYALQAGSPAAGYGPETPVLPGPRSGAGPQGSSAGSPGSGGSHSGSPGHRGKRAKTSAHAKHHRHKRHRHAKRRKRRHSVRGRGSRRASSRPHRRRAAR